MATLSQMNPNSTGGAMQNPYGIGGSQYANRSSDAQTWAWQALYDQLGRPPTDSELAQAVPSFMGADPNITNVSGGDAFVSQMVKALQAQTPDQSNQNAQQAAGQETQNIQAQFQNLLPELQSQFLQPLQQDITQQGQNQQGLMNQAIGGVQGITGQGAQTIQNLMNQGIGQQQGFNQQAQGQSAGLGQQAMQGQQGINSDVMNELQGIDVGQTNMLQQLMGNQTSDLMRQLTDPSAGSAGQNLQNYYNRLGLLDSGSFNQGLATQFGNLAGQQSQEILQNQINQQTGLQNAAQTGAGALSGLQSQDLSNQQGVANQGQSALTGILGQGLGDTANVYGAGLNSMLGLTGQNYGTQSQLGLGGLNAQQNVLQMPVTQGINQFNNQQGQGQSLQNLLTGQMFNQTDFSQQATLAQLLADQGAPSALQQDLGLASGAAQGAGSLGAGAGGLATATSYICMELIKRGLICEMDMDDFHVHIMPAMFKKGRAFWKYAMDGKRLVDAANANGLDWKLFKPFLFDRVMEEPNPCKAVDLYADACHQLCISSDPSLWDERVMRTSWMDSLPFIPLLLTYRPFQQALWKCLRIKTLILYDRPRCTHAR